MKYVIQLFDKYYVRDCGAKIEQIYDLEQATVFTSRKRAKECIDNTTFAEYSKIIKREDIISSFKEWKENGMVRGTIEKISAWSRKYNAEPLTEVIKFYIFCKNNENQVKYEHYKTWPKLTKFLDCFYDVEAYTNRECTEMYITFQAMVKKDSDFDKFNNELNGLLPYITYVEGGYKVLPIFDHELSEYESRSLHYNEKTKVAKIIGAYGEKYRGTLEECFNKIRSNYYYE